MFSRFGPWKAVHIAVNLPRKLETVQLSMRSISIDPEARREMLKVQVLELDTGDEQANLARLASQVPPSSCHVRSCQSSMTLPFDGLPIHALRNQGKIQRGGLKEALSMVKRKHSAVFKRIGVQKVIHALILFITVALATLAL